jgi:Protein of unknown function (DUF1353)
MVSTADPDVERHSSDRDIGFIGDHRVAVQQIDDKEWETLERLEYQATNQRFVVDPHRTTDFASIPRPFSWFIPRYGRYTPAAVLHDYLCRVEVREGRVTRADADGIFRQAMRLLEVPFLRRWIMWTGVRIGALRHRADRQGWWAGGSWRVLPFIALAAPIVLPAAVVIVVTMPIQYVVERAVWLVLEVTRRFRAKRGLPTKKVNSPALSLRT